MRRALWAATDCLVVFAATPFMVLALAAWTFCGDSYPYDED